MPFDSEAQRGLMNAVAAGTARKSGISKATAKKLVAEDTGGKLPARSRKTLSAAILTERKNNLQGS
jgi:hypothetical protein